MRDGQGQHWPLEGWSGRNQAGLGLGRQERGLGWERMGRDCMWRGQWDTIWQLERGELGWGWPQRLPVPTDPPDPPKLSALLDVDQGHMAVFVCTVDSSPLAQLTLYHGERLLATSLGPQLPSRGHFHAKAMANSLQLEVRGLGLGDSGSYRCEATNVLGSANTSLFFQVRGECQSPGDVVDALGPFWPGKHVRSFSAIVSGQFPPTRRGFPLSPARHFHLE